MRRGEVRAFPGELTAASAAPLVLTLLEEGERDGYALVRRMRELPGEKPWWADAMVYPLFHRLRRRGYVTAEWRTSGDGRRRRYYAITDSGRAALARRHGRSVGGRRVAPRPNRDGWLLAPLVRPSMPAPVT